MLIDVNVRYEPGLPLVAVMLRPQKCVMLLPLFNRMRVQADILLGLISPL
jgi:hypothetical protein